MASWLKWKGWFTLNPSHWSRGRAAGIGNGTKDIRRKTVPALISGRLGIWWAGLISFWLSLGTSHGGRMWQLRVCPEDSACWNIYPYSITYQLHGFQASLPDTLHLSSENSNRTYLVELMGEWNEKMYEVHRTVTEIASVLSESLLLLW